MIVITKFLVTVVTTKLLVTAVEAGCICILLRIMRTGPVLAKGLPVSERVSESDTQDPVCISVSACFSAKN